MIFDLKNQECKEICLTVGDSVKTFFEAVLLTKSVAMFTQFYWGLVFRFISKFRDRLIWT